MTEEHDVKELLQNWGLWSRKGYGFVGFKPCIYDSDLYQIEPDITDDDALRVDAAMCALKRTRAELYDILDRRYRDFLSERSIVEAVNRDRKYLEIKGKLGINVKVTISKSTVNKMIGEGEGFISGFLQVKNLSA